MYLCPEEWDPLRLEVDFEDPDIAPWILADLTFVPSWIPGAPREIFVAAYDNIERKVKQLVSYRMHLPAGNPDSFNGQGSVEVREDGERCILRHSRGGYHSPLTLISRTVAPATKLPWLPHSLSNAGRMLSIKDKVLCFSLFIDAEQPVNTLELDEDIMPGGSEREPTMTSVDPWSGAIVVATPGRVRVFYLQ